MQYNIHLPYYNETFLYEYGFGIRCYGIKEAALSKGGLCLKSFFLSQVDF